MFTVTQIKDNLIGMGHGATLNKVRKIESLLERVASKFVAKCKPLETMRVSSLASTIHDDVYNYALPADFNSLVDLIPQDNRSNWDKAYRKSAGVFDLQKAIKDKTISIEGSEGSKIIRINWRSRQGKLIHAMNSLTDNGTWSGVGTATGLKINTIFKKSGNASIEFDIVTTGDGIQNTTMNVVDLTDEDEVADFFAWVYFATAPTNVQAVWGNDLTTNYWTSVAQTTQADGTAFKTGWNLIKFPWASATESGTVVPSTVDSFKIIVASSAQNNVRVDNIVCSIGRNFDIKYYSKYLFKSTAGTYLSQTTDDTDYVTIDNDTLPIFLYECLKEMAHQMEGTDSAFDISYAEKELQSLYPAFRSEHPDQRKKQTSQYGGLPRFNRRF
jgi:hypothetical protein